jgi:hypothetical protein
MAPQSWPGALSGASKIVNAPLPRLHKANVVCEECYVAEECGATPRADGHSCNAADLMANLALRRPPSRPLQAAITFGPVLRCSGCERGAQDSACGGHRVCLLAAAKPDQRLPRRATIRKAPWAVRWAQIADYER